MIPPGAEDFRVEVEGTLPNDTILLSFCPHMHLRGKRFEYDIVHDDGTVATLLRVNYHFHWELSYKLAEPRELKAGTRLRAVAWYDNSRNNPHNPDPEKMVTWGDRTLDEMMLVFSRSRCRGDGQVAVLYTPRREWRKEAVTRRSMMRTIDSLS